MKKIRIISKLMQQFLHSQTKTVGLGKQIGRMGSRRKGNSVLRTYLSELAIVLGTVEFPRFRESAVKS